MFGDMSEDGEELVVSLNAVKGSGMLRSRRYTPSPSPSPSAASVGTTSDSSSSESEESDLSVEMIETDEKDEPGDEKANYESPNLDDPRGLDDESDVETFYSLFESFVCL